MKYNSAFKILSAIFLAFSSIIFDDGSVSAEPKTSVSELPPMGWNDWNSIGCKVSEDVIKHQADLLISSGLAAAGYKTVTIDDCWMNPDRNSSGNLFGNPTRFPEGMKALGDYLHSHGLKFGIYESPNAKTCAQIGGGYPGSTGSLGYYQQDANTFASWGVDFLKFDWCAPRKSYQQQYDEFKQMKDALKATGRKITYYINPNTVKVLNSSGRSVGASQAVLPEGEQNWSDVAQMVRATSDVEPDWIINNPNSNQHLGVEQALDLTQNIVKYTKPGYWTDLDMLVLGVIPKNSPGLTLAESRTQLGMWAMLSAPLTAGNNLDIMTPEIKNLLTNPNIIRIDQDPLVTAAKFRGNGSGSFDSLPVFPPAAFGAKNYGGIWVKPLSDKGFAIALTNPSDKSQTLKFDIRSLGLYKAKLINAWSGKIIKSTEIKSNIEPHDTQIYLVSALN